MNIHHTLVILQGRNINIFFYNDILHILFYYIVKYDVDLFHVNKFNIIMNIHHTLVILQGRNRKIMIIIFDKLYYIVKTYKYIYIYIYIFIQYNPYPVNHKQIKKSGCL